MRAYTLAGRVLAAASAPATARAFTPSLLVRAASSTSSSSAADAAETAALRAAIDEMPQYSPTTPGGAAIVPALPLVDMVGFAGAWSYPSGWPSSAATSSSSSTTRLATSVGRTSIGEGVPAPRPGGLPAIIDDFETGLGLDIVIPADGEVHNGGAGTGVTIVDGEGEGEGIGSGEGGLGGELDRDPLLAHTRRTYQPSNIRKKRKHGFRSRLETTSGRRVLRKRRQKGRWVMSVSG
jgi:large subunit ribosomal protein L34